MSGEYAEPHAATTYQPADQRTAFDPDAYLAGFYTSARDDAAMRLALFFLPGMAVRLGAVDSLLDVGSGPAVHVALAFRSTAARIFLSDLSERNRDHLRGWWRDDCDGQFDWAAVIRHLNLVEGLPPRVAETTAEARRRVAGVLACDVLDERVVVAEDGAAPAQFHVVTSFFCLEYATTTESDYRKAVANVCRKFGGMKFCCYNLSKDVLYSAVGNSEIDVAKSKYIENNGVFMLLAKKQP